MSPANAAYGCWRAAGCDGNDNPCRRGSAQVVDYYKDKLVHIKADQAQDAVADQIRKAVGS